MRTLLLLLSLTLTGMGLPAAASQPASGFDQVIHPTGEFPADVIAVQEAVNVGGSILLKATDEFGQPQAFNFGSPLDGDPPAVVLLENAVEVHGETTGDGQSTIEGGYFAFFGVSKHETVISGIHFDRQVLSAVIYIASSGAEFVNNRVTDVIGVELIFPFPGITEGRGLKFLGNSDPAGAITGDIAVSGNVFDGLTADLSDAVVLDQVAADVTITDNTITNLEQSGILVINGSGDVEISRNHIAPGPGVLSPFSTGNGIVLVGGNPGDQRIVGNEVVAVNPWADGIVVCGVESEGGFESVVVDRNSVHLGTDATPGLFGAITLVGDVNGAVITSNRISGDASLGVNLLADLFGCSAAPADSTMVGNSVGAFDAVDASFFFDTGTRGNLLVGSSGLVIDNGVDNVIVGPGSRGRDIGRQVSDAQQRKYEPGLLFLSGFEPAASWPVFATAG